MFRPANQANMIVYLNLCCANQTIVPGQIWHDGMLNLCKYQKHPIYAFESHLFKFTYDEVWKFEVVMNCSLQIKMIFICISKNVLLGSVHQPLGLVVNLHFSCGHHWPAVLSLSPSLFFSVPAECIPNIPIHWLVHSKSCIFCSNATPLVLVIFECRMN